MNDDISAKSTKNEILEAYHEALQQLKAVKKSTKPELKAIEEQKDIVVKAAKHSTDDIVKNIATLKLSLVRSLEDIEEQLMTSYKQLTGLQLAIEIQNKELTDLYEIKANADSLAALLHAQKGKSLAFDEDLANKSRSFEQDMAQKRAFWKKEQEEFETSHKEYEQQILKKRQREQDEYEYTRNLTRQKERDQYMVEKETLEKELAAKRNALEQEFATREAKILAQEQEFQQLKQKAETFPEELQKAVDNATTTLSERLTFKFDYETKLAQKEQEGEKRLFQQMITALEAKVTHLETQAKHLSEKSNQANLQVQDIAVKAIESASMQRFIPTFNEKPAEQVK